MKKTVYVSIGILTISAALFAPPAYLPERSYLTPIQQYDEDAINEKLETDPSYPLHLAFQEALICASPNTTASQKILQLITNRFNPATINQQNEDGDTALHQCAIIGHQKMMKALLKKGADPTIRNKNGKLPIDLAVAHRTISQLPSLQKAMDRRIGTAILSIQQASGGAPPEGLHPDMLHEIALAIRKYA